MTPAKIRFEKVTLQELKKIIPDVALDGRSNGCRSGSTKKGKRVPAKSNKGKARS